MSYIDHEQEQDELKVSGSGRSQHQDDAIVAHSYGADESLLLQGADDDDDYENDRDYDDADLAVDQDEADMDPDVREYGTPSSAMIYGVASNRDDDEDEAAEYAADADDAAEYAAVEDGGSENAHIYADNGSYGVDEAGEEYEEEAAFEADNGVPAMSATEATDEFDARDESELVRFDDLGLSADVLKAIKHEGFEQPTPIQERAIPVILSGRDMIGQAQTGTGKTAAFALPILSLLPSRQKRIFALVLEPTRELALQVAESFSRFAHFIDDFRVAPIYGGASYESQIRSLRHGAQVVVATPGRLIDLIEKGRLDFSEVRHIVIDEADEMLRMGFIDDVDWILDKVPGEHQTALFSATMPPVIRRIATAHLTDPEQVRIESHTTTATTVRQRYWVATGAHKIDAMTRMLEVEPYEAVLVFVRTKTDAEDVANKLAARGLACAALHGDIPQRQREKIIERLKSGSLDIIIATDVAARGLDVDRITHVFNYDIPYDAESYVHRIGRTGRAGRTGEAILFVSPRERRALRQIERVTHQRIEPMRMPTIADVNKRRLENFRNQVLETIEAGNLEPYLEVISDLLTDDSLEPEMLAAALAKMAQRDGSLLLDESEPEPKMRTFDDHDFGLGPRGERRRGGPSAEPVPLRDFPNIKMVRYRLAVGRRDVVKPGQIVGAIANEANIDSKYIGEISIYDTFSVVDLPEGMPRETMDILARARVCGRPLDLRVYSAEPPRRRERPDHDRFERRHERFDRDERREREHDRFDRDERRERERDRFDRDERRPRRPLPHEDHFALGEDFSYMDSGEYRHEKGDINGNSINYREERESRFGGPAARPHGKGGKGREFSRPGFDFGSRRGGSRAPSRPRPRFGSSHRGF